MAKIPVSYLVDNIRNLLTPDDKTVYFQSRIATVGHLFEGPIESLVPRLLEAVEEAVGPDRTLVFPSYTFSFGKARLYDPQRSKPETGVLAECAWKNGGYARTVNPMINYLVRGRLSNEILSLKSHVAWGDDSVLAWLADNNAKAIALGFYEKDFGWTVVHRAENIARVPYRYFKCLKGNLELEGQPAGPCQEIMFVRPLRFPCRQNNASLNRALNSNSSISVGAEPKFNLRAVNCYAAVQATLDLLADDPYALIMNGDEVRQWAASYRRQEIADLAADERCSDLNAEID